jgi:hypothetical protein
LGFGSVKQHGGTVSVFVESLCESSVECNGALSQPARDGLHNPREAVIVRIGRGYKAPFCSQ